MKKYLYLIKNSKISTYLKYWLMYSSKKISLLIQSLPITLENTIKDLKIVINKIYGNSEQNTTTGKNLLPPLNSGSLNGLTFTTNSNGITTISGTTTSTTNYFKNVNKILPAGTYTLSINLSYTPPASSSQLILQSIDNVRLATINLWKITSKTFTLSADTEIKNYYIFSNSGIQHNGTISIQLEEGSTATSYEPYTGGQPSPSPDYPQEIRNVTGDVEVKVQNKNLFDGSKEVNTNFTNSVATALNHFIQTGEYATGYCNNSNQISAYAGVYETCFVPISENTNYYISSQASENNGFSSINILDKNGNLLQSSNNWIGGGYAFTTPSNAKYLMFGTRIVNIDYIQLIKGTTSIPLVPHKEQVLPLTLGNIELCKIGEYQDYLYKKDGKWYKYNAINKLVLNGSENWATGSFGTNSYLLRIIDIKYPLNANDTGLFIKSSHFRGIPITSRLTSGDNLIYVEPSPFINIRNTPFTSISDFKTWLSTHNTIVYYVLATPTDTEITDVTLISQLEEISKTLSYQGQTNISSNQNIYLDIDYIKRG